MIEENINEIYLELLKKQFCEAYGLRKFDNHSKEYLEGLKYFIEIQKVLGKKYNRFLKYIGLDISTIETAELNKGNVDSIIKSYNTLAITPYPIDIDKDRIHNDLDIDVKRFITQNPYDKNEFKILADLYNDKETDILLGVYGKTYDKDSYQKMKLIKKLSKKIKDHQYKVGLLKDNDDYFFIVYTNIYQTRQQIECIKKTVEKGNLIKERR